MRKLPKVSRNGSDDAMTDLQEFLCAAAFAARKHRLQKRKDADASPYINHPIEVAAILASDGGVTDVMTLAAAVLHDTLEDTETTPAELAREFGPAIRDLVQEVTDDRRLPKAIRKAVQVAGAPHLSARAKLIRIADKIANVRDVTHHPPAHWDIARRREYLDWTAQVIAGCRGASAALETLYDRVLQEAWVALGADG